MDKEEKAPRNLSAYELCCNGSKEGVQEIISREGKSFYTYKLLLLACEHGHKDIVEMLASNGDDLHGRGKFYTPMGQAAKGGQNEMVKFLISEGVGVNPIVIEKVTGMFSQRKSESPLLIAVREGHIEVIITLLDNGASINSFDDCGDSVIHCACMEGNYEVVELLLKRGADVNELNDYYQTPLFVACLHDFTDIAKLLLRHNADTDIGCKFGKRPLNEACDNENFELVEILVDTMIKNGITLCGTGKYEIGPIHEASYRGNVNLVNYLVSKGADIRETTDMGNTAMHIAAEKGHEELLKFLLEKGIDPPNEEDYEYEGPLHLAAERGHLNIVKMLIETGMDPNLCSPNKKTPLYFAILKGQTKVANFLLSMDIRLPNDIRMNKNDSRELAKNCRLLNMETIFIDEWNQENTGNYASYVR